MATDKPTQTKKITSVTVRENAKRDHSPNWDNSENWSGEEFTSKYHSAMTYYNLNYTSKDLKVKVVEWMNIASFPKSTIANFKKTKDSRCGVTMGSIAACLLKGMPHIHEGFNKGRNTADWLIKEINSVLEAGSRDAEEAEEKLAKESAQPQISNQDRVKEQAGLILDEILDELDIFSDNPENFDPKNLKFPNLFRVKDAKPAHIKIIKQYFNRTFTDLTELASGNADPQLRESYSHLPRKYVRKLIEFYTALMTACDYFTAEAKVLKKPKAKKVKPANELIKSLKFKVSDDKLSVSSVPPQQIIGAQAMVVYNTATRKIGIYYSKSTSGFNVKGTTLLEFTEKSTQKTLRKPLEQLKEFKEINTQRRAETWYNKTLTTVETALNGRFNEETIILKVYK